MLKFFAHLRPRNANRAEHQRTSYSLGEKLFQTQLVKVGTAEVSQMCLREEITVNIFSFSYADSCSGQTTISPKSQLITKY